MDTQLLRTLISEKNELCAGYEELTNFLMTCDDDDLAKLFERRGKLSQQIDSLNAQIKKQLNISGHTGGMMYREELPDELKWVYDISTAGFASLNRVRNAEPLLMGRLLALKKVLEDGIKSMSNTPKIANYLQSNTSTTVSGSLFSEET